MKNKLLVVLLFLGITTAVHSANAFSLLDGLDGRCLTDGNCSPCDVLRVAFNLGKFIFMTTGGLALLFGLWQALTLIISFGNAEAVRAAKSKIVNTIIAVVIIMASFLLVGSVINFLSGSSATSWRTGPVCETERPTVGPAARPTSISDAQKTANTCAEAYPQGTFDSVYRQGGGYCIIDGQNYKIRGIFIEQCQDVSSALQTLIKCIYNNASNKDSMVITSISHDCGFKNCKKNYQSVCEHKQNSCHFGGSNPNATQSEAIDLGLEFNEAELKTILEGNCKSYRGYYDLSENNTHHHISDSACNTY